MNWKDEAMEKLRNYDAMRQSLTIIPEELQRLEQEASDLRSVQFDRPVVKSNGNRKETALINNLVQRQELARNFQQAQFLVRNTDLALGVLNMVFQTIGIVAALAGRSRGMTRIVLTGNLSKVPVAKRIFKDIETLYNVEFFIPGNSDYATAIGAAISGI